MGHASSPSSLTVSEGSAIAEKTLRLGVCQRNGTAALHDDHGIWSGFQKPVELLFCVTPLGDVTNGTDNESLQFGDEGAEADLHGDFGAISAQGEKLQSSSHRSRAWITEEI